MSTPALLPCPFCGGEATCDIRAKDDDFFGIWCEPCGVQFDPGGRAAITAAWNRRALPLLEAITELLTPADCSRERTEQAYHAALTVAANCASRLSEGCPLDADRALYVAEAKLLQSLTATAICELQAADTLEKLQDAALELWHLIKYGKEVEPR